MTELAHLEVIDGVATITLDSPRNRNAMSRQLTTELSAHLATASADTDVRFIVLTHTGTVFCSGADLAESQVGSATTGTRAAVQLVRQIVEAPQPVITVLRGPVRAGGTGLVAASDVALVADHVDFAFAEVAIGVVPAIISIPLLLKVDVRAASRYLLSAARFDAAEAERIGLVTKAVPADEIDAVLEKELAVFRRTAPNAVAVTKRILNRSMREALDRYGNEMVELSAEMFATEEAKAGMQAFLTKTAPPWAP
ncbi:MAG: enoyl-CoA hydratase-related protein [Propionibacteriales bacterium]|nr:enoyl-CoA hydratase-related protein [Propionibacteriales bacterium]